MLTDRQQFRLGFLQKCAEDGLTTEQSIERAKQLTQMAKMAIGPAAAGTPISALWDNPITAGISTLSRSLGSLAIPMAIAGPPIVGAIGGNLLSKVTDVDDETVKAIRKRELIDEIRRNRQLLEQKRRSYRP